MNWLTDGLGVLGILTTFCVYQQKERKNLLIWKLITDTVWILHYFTLGAYSACAITVVAIFRSIVFLNAKHPWAQSKAWLYIFMAASLLFSLIAWQNPYRLLTLISSQACIIAYWIKSPKMTRLITIPAAILYLIYTIAYHSIEGTVCEVFTIVSSIVGLIRHDIKPGTRINKKKEKTV